MTNDNIKELVGPVEYYYLSSINGKPMLGT